ncbi:phage repressor protein C with HTH and peptisase S24 domain [Lewinella aquimaris]|uniref:Phage repressor protein C with HTH and peptisase S24 domain n=1 Tax=Neolewinella aquimaris TaxID=1835722 RepID=A0A840DY48_9BACT|nr:LexA family transcriptional regulator [Neolewinella aquimaris]MBB4077850.1 phage repressor protein C with HTH and peptisase S24 domain [Neolewinella aquimaris]
MKNVVSQRFIKCHDKLKAEKRIRSSRAFAMSLDYLPQSLSEILKGRRDVTIELLRQSIAKYKLNPVYLFTGDGPMFMTEESDQNFRVLTTITTPDADELIVHVPLPAQSVYAAELGDPSFVESLPTYSLPDYKYKVGTHRSFDVPGNSMEPTLFEGDKVVCAFLEPTLWQSGIKDNYAYVIVTRSDVVVKRVRNHIADAKTLEVISDNSFYETYHIPLSDLREIWYVRARITPFLPSPQNIQRYVHDEMSELKATIAQQGKLISRLGVSVEKALSNRNRE